MIQKQANYTEAWTNANTGEVIIREPYKVIDWTKLNDPAGTGGK